MGSGACGPFPSSLEPGTSPWDPLLESAALQLATAYSSPFTLVLTWCLHLGAGAVRSVAAVSSCSLVSGPLCALLDYRHLPFCSCVPGSVLALSSDSGPGSGPGSGPVSGSGSAWPSLWMVVV